MFGAIGHSVWLTVSITVIHKQTFLLVPLSKRIWLTNNHLFVSCSEWHRGGGRVHERPGEEDCVGSVAGGHEKHISARHGSGWRSSLEGRSRVGKFT